MKTRIYDHELRELAIESSYPSNFKGEQEIVTERTYSASPFMGKGSYKELFFEGFHIGFGEIDLSRTSLVHFDSDFETVEMHFGLDGAALTQSNCLEREIFFGRNQHNLIYVNGFEGKSEWYDNVPMKVFEVNIVPSLFQKYLPGHEVFDTFRAAIARKKSCVLSAHNFPITPQMMLTIKKIISCNRSGHFKKMFLEAQVIELLMLQLEQIASYQNGTTYNIKKHEIEKLYDAKEIITNHMNEPFSLLELAQQVGTNEFTLKKGFKELFGTTVFGYWNELKMESAKQMLTEEGLTVTEVSEKVGYKNPQHFSTAFKRKYGLSPRELKM